MKRKLLAWIKEKHHGQLIRLTDEPYVNHLLFVAEKAGAAIPLGYEIGLCHDLLEKTDTTANQLNKKLLSFGYPEIQALHITGCVVELTDVFTRKAFPELRKKERKKKEAARLAGISTDAQTVKYADLLYNINWTVTHDKKNMADYLHRKQKLIVSMTNGNELLRCEVLSLIAILV